MGEESRPSIAVIGMPRSGTGWLAKALGFTHEGYWNLRHYEGAINPQPTPDVSWLALPELETLSPGETRPRTIHIVRDPHKVCASLIANKFWEKDTGFTRFAIQNLLSLPDTYDPYEWSARFWVEWNQRCLLISNAVFKVEHLFEARFPAVERLASLVGMHPEEVRTRVTGSAPHNHRADYTLEDLQERVSEALSRTPGFDTTYETIVSNLL